MNYDRGEGEGEKLRLLHNQEHNLKMTLLRLSVSFFFFFFFLPSFPSFPFLSSWLRLCLVSFRKLEFSFSREEDA